MGPIKNGETLILQRGRQDLFGTHGVLIYGGRYVCFTLEEPWKDNARKVSCIPEGTYQVVKHTGAKFKDVWRLLDVPGRDAILIHAGNTIKDTEGCILVGLQSMKGGVAQSREAIALLRSILPSTFNLEVR